MRLEWPRPLRQVDEDLEPLGRRLSGRDHAGQGSGGWSGRVHEVDRGRPAAVLHLAHQQPALFDVDAERLLAQQGPPALEGEPDDVCVRRWRHGHVDQVDAVGAYGLPDLRGGEPPWPLSPGKHGGVAVSDRDDSEGRVLVEQVEEAAPNCAPADDRHADDGHVALLTVAPVDASRVPPAAAEL